MYRAYDNETENHPAFKRIANQFTGENYVVARGWKDQGDTSCSWRYFQQDDCTHFEIPEHITLLVGFNIKFDLLFDWKSPDLKAFFKRGGKIWDCQYAEYLLQAQNPKYHMCSMDDIIEKYGGTLKVDAVKACWAAGMLTSQIDKDMLIDYLVGTEKEKRNGGDIRNTELIFLGQIQKAIDSGMLVSIQQRMEGLLCTTEMEYNGLKIDIAEAARRMKIMEDELEQVEADLVQYVPEMPEGLEFNWASNSHKSALIFGGVIKYKKPAHYIDPKTGKRARLKAKADWPLFGTKPVNPKFCKPSKKNPDLLRYKGKTQDTFVSGLKKGQPKFKKVSVKGELKTRITEFLHELPGYTTPLPEWQSKVEDANGDNIYLTNNDVIEELGFRDIPFLKLMSARQDLVKDLGTYYVRYDENKDEYKGMLTCVMPGSHIVHHSLNHTSTVTTRLSSSDPNLQNVPKASTSEVKKMFISRFGKNGQMMEGDYSQLEVVGQGILSKDKNLLKDLNAKIDFHCKRVSAWKGCTYDEAVHWCKNDQFVDYAIWKGFRNDAKVFSFQRAYGAGAPKISKYTGIPLEDVQALIEAEDLLYPGIVDFNKTVAQTVKKSAKPFKDHTKGDKIYRRGYYQTFTGTKYGFRTYDAQDWQREKGITESFSPTEMKNYPVQGFSGEIVQIILGRLFRHFVKTNNYNGKAFLCNTVHDSVWFDVHNDVVDKVAKDVKRIMESVPEVLQELFGQKIPVPFPVEIEVGDNMYDKKVLHV